ncbi:MAG: hypothetical protein IJZ75_06160 [Clostridia bacterium]|nr:hypothetical protein [Clostridia bacterium]
MTVLSNLLSPLSLAFIVIVVGCFVGKIKISKVSLDLSGVLIVAIFAGWLLKIITQGCIEVNIKELEANMKFFSTFGTSLFISSIGVSTGSMLDLRKRNDINAMLIGSLMVIFAFVMMHIIYLIDGNIAISKLIGALCGALTTTPGLSAACELKNCIPEDVMLGYGCTYLFGVMATVLFVQITTRKLENSIIAEEKIESKIMSNAALSGIIQIGVTVILGRLIGGIEILNFSLGISGGMLCSGIVIGLFVKKVFPMKVLTTKLLAPFRNIGLVLFFVGNGIPAGMQVSEGIDGRIVFYGALMTVTPIVFGTLLYKFFFNDRLSATTIAGGMTSTPAVGVLVKKYSNISLSKYALAYFGALITIIILLRIRIFDFYV